MHIYKSHNLELLADKLSQQLHKNRPDDPLTSIPVIVPNLDTSRWLKLKLAQKLGVIANIEFLLPAEWQYRQIRVIYPDLPKTLPSDPDPMRWSIFNLLMDFKVRSQFPRLDEYTKSRPDERREEAVMQLARQIASVFDQYLMYRPEMILKWQSGKVGREEERWQANLWNLLQKKWKSDHSGLAGKNSAELQRKAFEDVQSKKLKVEGPLFVFNPGLIPKPILNLMKAASHQTEIFTFLLQVTESLKEKTGTYKNELLRSFGEEASQVASMYDVFGEYSEDEFTLGSTRDSLLQRIQSSVVEEKSIATIKSGNQKLTGVEIHSCHSRLREIETLHQFLLEQFEQDENLQPDDVLVVTPDLNEYQPVIDAVFGAVEDGLPQVPYHVGRSSFGPAEELTDTLVKFMDLLESRFLFSDVMDFLRLKPVRENFDLSDSDCSRIQSWMEENFVLWGLDGQHRERFDQPSSSNQTWRSALQRGWLGQLIGGEPGQKFEDSLIYKGISGTDEQQVWASFTGFLRKLNSAQKKISHKKTINEWLLMVEGWIDELFATSEVTTSPLIQFLDRVKKQTELAQTDREVSFGRVRSEIKIGLENRSASGAFFSRGITFSSMVPVRSIPAKVVALIGLNEETFPRKTTAPDFDLMALYPEKGDRNRKQEDRNLFMESILAAQDLHYVSFIGRSKFDNEQIPASPIVVEWVDQLSEITGLDSAEIIREEPLNGFSSELFREEKSYSKRYGKLAAEFLKSENGKRGLVQKSSLDITSQFQDEIDVDQFVRFFANPMKYYLREQFRVYLSDPDEEKNEFQFSHLEEHLLFQKMFEWKLEGKEMEELTSLVYDTGMVPKEWPGQKLIQEISGTVNRAYSELSGNNDTPIINLVEIDYKLNSNYITGYIYNYSNSEFLDIVPSKSSGKVLFQSWIRYLIYSLSGSSNTEGMLICNLKKDDPKRYIFHPVVNGELMLERLVELFRSGHENPLKFFPKTLYEYEKELKKTSEEKALEKAKKEFEGDDWSYPERDDSSINLILGEETPFKNEYVSEEYLSVMRDMVQNIREVK